MFGVLFGEALLGLMTYGNSFAQLDHLQFGSSIVLCPGEWFVPKKEVVAFHVSQILRTEATRAARPSSFALPNKR